MKTLTLGYYDADNTYFDIDANDELASLPIDHYVVRIAQEGKIYLEVKVDTFTASLIYQAQKD